MITAEEARKLSGKTVKEKVESLLKAVEALAKEKKRVLRCGYDHNEDQDLWIYGGHERTNEYKEAVKILSDLGYNVTFYYQESQFVDMYTKVEW